MIASLKSLAGIGSVTGAALYMWRRNSWMLDPRMLSHRGFSGPEIRRPIFLLGVQGGGLTLISRMIRRNRAVVSVTGNHEYWSGADEMQQVMGPILPPDLTGLTHKPPPHPTLTPPRSWAYACDELLPLYRRGAEAATEKMAQRLRGLITYCLARYGTAPNPVFTDKSQVFTVRVGLINRILRDTEPVFVLVPRNPYVSCLRAASGKAVDMKRYADRNILSHAERLRMCAEHWRNSFACALEDGEEVRTMLVHKFEDFLATPEGLLGSICDAAGLEYAPSMLPAPGDEVPAGSKHADRWYPIKRDVDDSYLARMTPEVVDIVGSVCGDLADQFGYRSPSL